jgi:hypothetical protein
MCPCACGRGYIKKAPAVELPAPAQPKKIKANVILKPKLNKNDTTKRGPKAIDIKGPTYFLKREQKEKMETLAPPEAAENPPPVEERVIPGLVKKLPKDHQKMSLTIQPKVARAPSHSPSRLGAGAETTRPSSTFSESSDTAALSAPPSPALAPPGLLPPWADTVPTGGHEQPEEREIFQSDDEDYVEAVEGFEDEADSGCARAIDVVEEVSVDTDTNELLVEQLEGRVAELEMELDTTREERERVLVELVAAREGRLEAVREVSGLRKEKLEWEAEREVREERDRAWIDRAMSWEAERVKRVERERTWEEKARSWEAERELREGKERAWEEEARIWEKKERAWENQGWSWEERARADKERQTILENEVRFSRRRMAEVEAAARREAAVRRPAEELGSAPATATVPATSGPRSGAGLWECTTCTFHNPRDSRLCAMCNTSRKSSSKVIIDVE